MAYYPVFIELEGETVLVVGGGEVARRKIESLLECGAFIHIVSKELIDKLKGLVKTGVIRHLGEEFRDEHLDEAFLVIAATDDKRLNHEISHIARRRGILINAVDQPADCSFIVPSVVRRGDLLMAISTSGKSPALARKIRKMLDSQFGSEYGAFLILMGRLRREILSKGFSQDQNRRIFQEIVDSDILEALAREDWSRVESTLKAILPEEVAIVDCLKALV